MHAQSRPSERQLPKTYLLLNTDTEKSSNCQRRHWLFVLWPEVFIKGDAYIVVIMNKDIGEQSTQPLAYIRGILNESASYQQSYLFRIELQFQHSRLPVNSE